MRLKTPDLTVILVVAFALLLLAAVTFDLWLPLFDAVVSGHR
jgi:hypothetical protein